ncbi:MAG: AzlD domain-containing protein [Candidatus Bipolaricaulota bacterium]|nr:AzlD domain-containing protein [Candidatus Bipolaricaulota bacterium]MBS3791612.1 AzlD domain-containing protein [Candidatus Bipolaricaulota bacterium]
MKIDNLFLLFAAMMAVTYIPRMLPFVLFGDVEFPPFIRNVLQNLRYAILGGLILPGILLINEDPAFGVIGGTVAFILAYLDIDVVFVVTGTIGVMALYTLAV